MENLQIFKYINTFVFDMDGVLSDGRVLVMSGTEWIRSMHIRDGHGIKAACKAGYKVIIISGSESSPVKKRLKLLGVSDIFMNIQDKKTVLEKCIKKYSLDINRILYMGDDSPDIKCLQIVGLPSCPNDAIGDVKNVSTYISPFKGGEGCVRDVIEKVLKLNGDWI